MSRSRFPPGRIAHPAVLCTVALVLVLVGCSAGDVDGETTEEAATAEGQETVAGTDEPDPEAEPAAEPADDEPQEIDEVEDRAPRLPLPDVDEVVLRTPATDVGSHPTLAWESVPDADRYQVTVLDEDGRTVWAWSTDDTEVILGGYEESPPEHVRGPQLYAPMHWYVLARDGDDRVIAQSGLRPIAP